MTLIPFRIDAPYDLPELIILTSDLPAAAKDLAALIAKRDDFFFNGHGLVHIVVDENGMPRASEVTPEVVRVLAHEICLPTKIKDGEKIRISLSRDVANLYLLGLTGRWGVRTLRGITTSPILDNGGSIRITDGYDEATGLWCHNIPQINVPVRPTENEASSALARLRAFFCTFPFKDAELVRDQARGFDVVDPGKSPGLHESSLLAAVMTSICRQSLELAPGFLCDAPNYSGAGTGKGLLVRAVCMIGSGARPSAFTSGHDAGELDKRVTSAVIEARPAIFLDNFNAKDLTSDVLASVLTESPSEVRVLGRTGMVKVYNRTFISVTGNAVQVAEDMARRWLNTHLDARMEDPERRPFPPGFLDRVYAARGDLLSAALTIWRWGRQNQMPPGIPIGSYEVWAQWCRDPLVALGARDPMERIAEIKAADPKRRALVAIFEQWWDRHRDIGIKASDLHQEVIKLIDDKCTTRDGELQYNRQSVVGWVAAHAGTRVGGYSLSQPIPVGPRSKRVAHYKMAYEPTEEEA